MSDQSPDNRPLSSPAALEKNEPPWPTATPHHRSGSIELGDISGKQDLSGSTGRISPHYPTQETVSQWPHSNLSPVLENTGFLQIEERPRAHQLAEDVKVSRRARHSRQFSRQSGRPSQQDERLSTRWSQMSKRLSRPLSFNGSIWLKQPEDIVLQFEFVDENGNVEYFDPPHHVFDRKKKKRLVYLVSLAAMFSPLSSNIYFPALDTIATVLHTKIELIALTITIYMLFQGIAPSFWGPLADSYGRRPIFLATLVVYMLSNVGLALTPNFASLMVFRGIQAIGSSSTIAIGAGVIGDIAAVGERGGFMGLFGGIRMFGQAIGPVFGGALSQYLGFRSIFYFLLGLAVLVLILLVLFLPETLRKIAGDGSRPLYGIYKPIFGYKRRDPLPEEEQYKPTKLSFSALFDSFRLLAEKDVFVTLLFGGIIYTSWSMMTSSTSALFKEEYHLTDVKVGLAFLPNGLGCVLGSLITGKIMDRDYKQEAIRYCRLHELAEDTELRQQDYPDFPIERARLRRVYILAFLFAVATGVYGYAVEWLIVIPLIMQFITAFTATAVFNINSTLMIDLYPSKPASATAINNLVRCTLGGIGVGLVEKGIETVDEAPVFLALAITSAVSMVLVWVSRAYGPAWRQERLHRIKMQQEQEAQQGVSLAP